MNSLDNRHVLVRPYLECMIIQAELTEATIEYPLTWGYGLPFCYQMEPSGPRPAVHCSHCRFPILAHMIWPQHCLLGTMFPRPCRKNQLLLQKTLDDSRRGVELVMAETPRRWNSNRRNNPTRSRIRAAELGAAYQECGPWWCGFEELKRAALPAVRLQRPI